MNGFNQERKGDETVFGLGKKRSKLGKWLDKRGISQTWLAKTSGVSRTVISDLCNGEKKHSPRLETIKKIMSALKKIDPNVKPTDFFDI
jgi:predicted transcriptional regulator